MKGTGTLVIALSGKVAVLTYTKSSLSNETVLAPPVLIDNTLKA